MTRLPLLLALCAAPALAQMPMCEVSTSSVTGEVTIMPCPVMVVAPAGSSFSYYTPTPDGSARIDWPIVCRLAAAPYPAEGPRSPLSGNVTAERIEWEFVQAIVRTAKERGRPGCEGDRAR